MTTKEQALAEIRCLVQRFDEQYTSYKNSTYNETLTRRDFIDPFFKALGWDIDNAQGYAEAYREVIHEDKVKIGKATKAPDYSFRLPGGKRLFFVEARKPVVSVKEEIQPAYQVRRYGWSAKMPISIITDFGEFAVYDCSKKPNIHDKASVARISYLTFRDYEKEFDFIWNTFSKEKVLKGSFDKFVQGDTYKKGTSTVDREFLQSLDNWRTLIAVDLCKNNLALNEDELNFIVQQTIDRIIFLRIAEDRSVEPYGTLKEAVQKDNYYQNLLELFKHADAKYNSGLFDFKKDSLSKHVVLDNKTLKTVISQLYYPESPYEFSVLPVEILGSVYEQFLGKQIKVDARHKAKIEEKAEVRKAGGVYYTPQYIVDFIVRQTIGKLLEDKKPADVRKIRIVDPACGSGSFLIGAYQFLLDWHKDYYSNFGKIPGANKNSPLTPDGNLTTNEKKSILTNNIFGVDLDSNAVEVTKLSLLLKCLEGETADSIKAQAQLFSERILPTFDSNIKSGNSLIGIDFYDNETDLGSERTIKPFDWKKEFAEVFSEGGFDAVIGNPPYGAELTKEVQKYSLKKYPIGNTDTAALFMVQAKNLLKKKGYNGYIIPKSFTYASNWDKTRKLLLDDIRLIVDCSKVWREVKLEMSVYISINGCDTNAFTSAIRRGQHIIEVGNIDKQLCDTFNFILNGVSEKEIGIALKMHASPKRINSYMTNKRGGMLQKFLQPSGDLHVLGGKQIQRFQVVTEAPNKIQEKNVTESIAYINPGSILVQNIVSHIQNPYPRIQIIAAIPGDALIASHVIIDTINQLTNTSELSVKYLLGVINSKPVSWYTYKFVFANAMRTMHFDANTTGRIPFPDIDLKKKTDKARHDEIVKLVDQVITLKNELGTVSLAEHRDMLMKKTECLESKIDRIVIELFDLNEEEGKIINNQQDAEDNIDIQGAGEIMCIFNNGDEELKTLEEFEEHLKRVGELEKRSV